MLDRMTDEGEDENEGDLSAVPSLADRVDQLLVQAVGSSEEMPILSGTVIAGRYEVQRVLGSGGMGIVYLVHDRSLDRSVALKVHHTRAHSGRLHREALAMAKLAHPNVVTVFEIGELNGRTFVTMEYVPGVTLREWLAADQRTWSSILVAVLAAGEGLAAAHEVGIVHRDVKPDNIFVGHDGRVRIGDFGLAQFTAAPAQNAAPMQQMTVTGTVIGTPAYMAPEQIEGRDLDARTDQFAFAIAAWEALCGVRPFGGATTDELYAAIRRGLVGRPRHRVPIAVRRLLERAMAADPEARWSSFRALRAKMEAVARPSAESAIAVVDTGLRDQQPTLREDLARDPASSGTSGAFVGRVQELNELAAGLAEARAGHGGLFLLSGGQGVGKTRLADHFARQAARDAVPVLWGRCWEGEGSPAYWPWIQVLRALMRERGDDSSLRACLEGQRATWLLHVIPELQPDLPRIARAPDVESPEGRFGLHDAVATLLREATKHEPMLVVLDDLHAADSSSTELLQFVARELRGTRLLIVGTYQDTEARLSRGRDAIARVTCEGTVLPLRPHSDGHKIVRLRRSGWWRVTAVGILVAMLAAGWITMRMSAPDSVNRLEDDTSRVVPSNGIGRAAGVPSPNLSSPEAARTRQQIVSLVAGFLDWAKVHPSAGCPEVRELANHGAASVVTDGWRRPLFVTCSLQPIGQRIGVISRGPDGALGTNDDLRSWELGSDVIDPIRGERWGMTPPQD